MYQYFRVPGTIRPVFSKGCLLGESLSRKKFTSRLRHTIIDSVEQKNYAVGEQRERDTNGWSASQVLHCLCLFLFVICTTLFLFVKFFLVSLHGD